MWGHGSIGPGHRTREMGAGSGTKSQVYVGTMVFSIVAAVISVMLVVFMIYGPPEARDYMYVVLTIEFGLLAVIVNSVAQIYMYERDMKKMTQDIASNLVVVDTCPDYYTRALGDDGRPSCSNVFVSPASRDVYELGVVAGSNAPFVANSGTIAIRDWTNKPLSDVCGAFAPNKALYGVPWTELRAKCESFNLL